MKFINFLFIFAFATTIAIVVAQDDNEGYYDGGYDSTPMADDPSEAATSEGSSSEDKDSSNPMGILGIVSLWPKGSFNQQGGNQERPPRPDRCSKWSDWKNVTCWWPDIAFSDLPKECTFMALPKKIPQDIQDLIRGKAQEAYDAIAYEYEQRGKPAKCGYCSRSFRCRSRNMTQDANDDGFDRRHHRRGGRGKGQCKPKEIQPVHEECDDHSPCELTKVDGICKTPFFLNPAKIDRVQRMMKQRDHQGAADELFDSMNLGGERRKRQAVYSNDDYGSDVYGYGMNPQYDSSNGFGGNQGGPWGWNNRQFGPNSGRGSFGGNRRNFGPGGDDQRPPFGPWNDNAQGSDERRGRQGPPLSFGPGNEGQRGPYGPREDERRGPFEPDGRRGRQGPPPPPPPPFGPDGDDRRGGFGPADDERRGPFGPGGWGPDGRKGRQGPPPPFGPGGDDDDRRGPFGPDGRRGRQGPPPPFGPGGDDDERRGPDGRRGRQGPPPPFGPGGDDDRRRGFGPRDDDRWGPFGPDSRRGRQGPPPPPFGPPGRGRWWPRPPFGPPGRRHGHFPPSHRGPWGFGFGGNQENQRQASIENGRGDESRGGFVYRLLHETNCVNANGTCLCCCGPYIPNIQNNTCDDLRQLFPGIEDTADALMMNGSDQGPPPPMPPMEPPMAELSPSDESEMDPPQRRQNIGKIPKPEHDF